MQELASVASGDEIAVFDVSETGNVKTKKATVSNIAAGAGAVIGPASSTDNAAVRFDSTTGKLVQNSAFLIDDTGHVTSFGGQIKFPAAQAASADANTLDDCEKGTVTLSVGGTATYNSQVGTYTKIGRQVFIQGTLDINVLGTGSTNTVSGLPFTSAGTGPGTVGYFTGLALSVTSLGGYSGSGTTNFVLAGTTAAQANITNGIAVLGNSAVIIFGDAYYV